MGPLLMRINHLVREPTPDSLAPFPTPWPPGDEDFNVRVWGWGNKNIQVTEVLTNYSLNKLVNEHRGFWLSGHLLLDSKYSTGTVSILRTAPDSQH